MNQKIIKFFLSVVAIATVVVAVLWGVRVQTFSIARDTAMKAFEIGIGTLVKEEPAAQSEWNVGEFRFVGNEGFYVEYTDEQDEGVLVIEVAPTFLTGVSYDLVGRLEPASGGFVLATGTDPFVGREVDIYRKSQDTNEWQLVN